MKLFMLLALISSSVFAKTGGRYEIHRRSEKADDLVMLDTQTGKTWARNCAGMAKGGLCVSYYWYPEVTHGVSTKAEIAAYAKDAAETVKYVNGEQ